jgi:hypothetical protein
MQLAKLIAPFVVVSGLLTAPALAAEPENTMVITLKDGDVTVALRPDLAPKHVEQIKALVREGAYDNVAFHRVIEGFMAQTGDVQFGDMEEGFDRAGPERADLPGPTCLPNSPMKALNAARSAWLAATIRTPRTRSSSSCSRRLRI